MSNVHPSSSKGYKLPFDLKVKPARHYFPGGSIHFMCIDGVLLYEVIVTSKLSKYSWVVGRRIHTKDQLDKLLKIKSLSEIQRLTSEVMN